MSSGKQAQRLKNINSDNAILKNVTGDGTRRKKMFWSSTCLQEMPLSGVFQREGDLLVLEVKL